MSKPAPSNEDLDKLKRRLIRSIARLMKEKKTEEEVWTELKKECGTNCKTLWLRMRSLTLKKLKRLLDADDRVENVPAIARMTLTDWLLYDLVLVHEKIDVINRGSQKDSTVLENLFSLVQRFEIEGRQGDDLAEAWTAATVAYNSKGHQCSPMLMQRRWYQIKELTRHKLYKFWFAYRGYDKRLNEAKADEPTPLQRAISLRYPEIVTTAFPNWTERIEQKLVIMPDEFEVKMRRKVHMKPTDEEVPDVVIVEKKIDVITIDSDSDFAEDENITERMNEEADAQQTPFIVQVKTEPTDDIDITEHPVQPEEPKDKFQAALERLAFEEDRIITHDQAVLDGQETKETFMPYITNVQGAISYKDDINVTENVNVPVPVTDTNENNNRSSTEENNLQIVDDKSQPSIVIDDDDANDDDVSLSQVAQNKRKNQTQRSSEKVINASSSEMPEAIQENFPIMSYVTSGKQVRSKLEMNTDFPENIKMVEGVPSDNNEGDDIIKISPEIVKSNMELAREIVAETNFGDDGVIEFADDGIEEHDLIEDNEFSEAPDTEEAGSPKFDLKLLMNPVVYTTKIDDMAVYKGKSIYKTICQKDLFDKILIESKPISSKAINVEQIKTDNQLLKAENVKVKVENAQEFEDDIFHNEISNDEDKLIDSKRVKLTSSLLQKPKTRSYHLIQLCKNPDFNMRLKRLTMGFFSHERNRMFLKDCKPMTIDLSKAFESKLVNGTMYLKPSATVEKPEVKVEFDSTPAATVQPSAGPIKSLIEKPDVDKILQDELQKRMSERNKTITLPNISLVRKINQNLLMAEVAPIIAPPQNQNLLIAQVAPMMAPPQNYPALQTVTVQDLIETVLDGKNTSKTQISPPPQTQNLPIETPPVTNTVKPIEKPTQESALNLNAPILPMMPGTRKSGDDAISEKQKKKKYQPGAYKPAWLTKAITPQTIPKDTLLTLDTLYKILTTLDPACVPYKHKTKTKTHDQEYLSNHRKSTAVKKDRKPTSKSVTTTVTKKNDHPVSEKTDAPVSEKTYLSVSEKNEFSVSETTDLTIENNIKNDMSNVQSITIDDDDSRDSISTKKKKCCWARAKILKIAHNSKTKLAPHKCKDRCKCCCKEALRKLEIKALDQEIKLLEKMQGSDTYVETIEQVVQQSRDTHSQVSGSAPNAVTPITINAKSTKKVQHASLSSTSEYDATANTKSQIESASLSKNGETQVPIDIGNDDDSDNGNDVTMSEPEPEQTQNKESEQQAPKATFRVYSAPAASEHRKEMPEKRTEAPLSAQFIQIPLNSQSRRRPSYKGPILVPAAPLIQPIITVPPASIEEPAAMTTPPTLAPPIIGTVTKERSKPFLLKRKQPKAKVLDSVKEVGQFVPCTCRPTVGQQNQSPMLVVDGSSDCNRHTTSRVSKETRIYLSRKHMSSAQRPVYVGKNKILLTNVKPPRLQTPIEVPQPQPLPAHVVSSEETTCVEATLDIPAGLQVVILPDGSVSYVLDPGTELTQQQINDMPLILQAVKSQIGAKSVTLPEYDGPITDSNVANNLVNNESSKEIETINDAEKTSNTNDQLKESENISDTKTSAMEGVQDNMRSESQSNVTDKTVIDVHKDEDNDTPECVDNSSNEKEHTLETNEDEQNVAEENKTASSTESISNMETPVIGTTEKSKEVLNPESDNTNQTNETGTRSDTPTGSSRNLLSDLMEMSGILDDDVTTVQPEVAPNSESLGQTVQILGSEQSFTTHQIRPPSPDHQICAQINQTTYDLHPIISFSDLKYACDNNGLFFKLDFNTGLIVPINVCIQKSPESGSTKASTEVIDLTAEPNDSDVTEPNDSELNNSRVKQTSQTPSESFNVTNVDAGDKKVRLKLKNVQSMMPNREIMKRLLMKRLSNNLKPLKILQQQNNDNLFKKGIIRPPRKQNLNRNRENATIDMVDSDAPMEEEYLDDFSDESDDEPLAKVAKKMRDDENLQAELRETLNVLDETMNETEKETEPENTVGRPDGASGEHGTTISETREARGESSETTVEPSEPDGTMEDLVEAINDSGDSMDIDDGIDFESAIHAVSIPVNSKTEQEKAKGQPVPTQLMLSGPTVKQPIILNDAFLKDEEEDSQDDCILGV